MCRKTTWFSVSVLDFKINIYHISLIYTYIICIYVYACTIHIYNAKKDILLLASVSRSFESKCFPIWHVFPPPSLDGRPKVEKPRPAPADPTNWMVAIFKYDQIWNHPTSPKFSAQKTKGNGPLNK